jgi:hypothetical protein
MRFGCSPPTAKTLSVRAVFSEPQEGQVVFSAALDAPDIVRSSRSNFASHAVQVYS